MKKIFRLSRSELAPEIKELLNKNGITCTVGGTDFAEIFVSEDEYESSLRKAIEVLESNDLQDKKENDAAFDWTCWWADPYDTERQLGWLPIFYGVLPKNREGKYGWCLFDRPFDFQEFLSFLQTIVIRDVPSCDTRKVMMDYHRKENAYEFSVPGKMSDFEKIQSEIRKYVEGYQKFYSANMPFESIHWTSPIGKWDKKVQKEESHSKLYSYLSHSYFLRALKHPGDDCVRYHNREGNSFGYQSPNRTYQTRNLEIHPSLLQPGVREGYDGTFTVASSKVFANYIETSGKEIKLKNPEEFTMIDNGTFKSYVSYNMEQDQIDVRTIIDLTRSTVGYDFDQKGLRDAIFKYVPQSDYQGRVEVNEHFKTFANGTKLVHFVDDSEYCAIYDLPTKLNPFQGIESLKGTAYPSWKQISSKMGDYNSLLETIKPTQTVATKSYEKILKP